MGLLIEGGLVAADQVRVWHAAREAARTAAVTADPGEITGRARASGLGDATVVVTPADAGRSQGAPVTATVTYKHRPRVPLLGDLLAVVVKGSATMRIETP